MIKKLFSSKVCLESGRIILQCISFLELLMANTGYFNLKLLLPTIRGNMIGIKKRNYESGLAVQYTNT